MLDLRDAAVDVAIVLAVKKKNRENREGNTCAEACHE